MLCIRRRSLLLAISLRIRLSWSLAVSGVRGMLARLREKQKREGSKSPGAGVQVRGYSKSTSCNILYFHLCISCQALSCTDSAQTPGTVVQTQMRKKGYARMSEY
ncbi:hypothetical protein XENOCAPTIV_004251 [Xenoophorus captivus]|uniref:Secreted protein n=1 Tax=Xenoophorus captivus TaxID=1517983 RepID=A0ABV0RZI1_9TELE